MLLIYNPFALLHLIAQEASQRRRRSWHLANTWGQYGYDKGVFLCLFSLSRPNLLQKLRLVSLCLQQAKNIQNYTKWGDHRGGMQTWEVKTFWDSMSDPSSWETGLEAHVPPQLWGTCTHPSWQHGSGSDISKVEMWTCLWIKCR